MAAPRVTSAMANEFFKEAIAILGLWAYPNSNATTINQLIRDPRWSNDVLTLQEVGAVSAALNPALLEAVGLYVLVYPYERYVKFCIASGQTANAAQATAATVFGVATIADQASFQSTYPDSQVVTWQQPAGAGAQWPLACIRNSFAHGQSVGTQWGGPPAKVGLNITNTRDGVNLNLNLNMTTRDFLQLVQSSAYNFINTAVTAVPPNGPTVEPLVKLLKVLTA